MGKILIYMKTSRKLLLFKKDDYPYFKLIEIDFVISPSCGSSLQYRQKQYFELLFWKQLLSASAEDYFALSRRF